MLNSTFLIVLAMFSISVAGLDTADIKDHRYIILFYIYIYVYSGDDNSLAVLSKRILAMRQGYISITPNEEGLPLSIHTTPSNLQENVLL